MQQYENDKEKDIRIPWDQYEVALLIDAYNKIVNNPENRTNIIQNLSVKLRNRAKNYLHIDINDTFRNFNGVNMRIGNIKYLFTNGLNGLSSGSQLDKEIYELYKNNYEDFLKIKNTAEQQIDNISQTKDLTKKDLEKLKINNSNLSTRAVNVLIRNGIYTAYDLVTYKGDLFSLKNLGGKTLREIQDYMSNLQNISELEQISSLINNNDENIKSEAPLSITPPKNKDIASINKIEDIPPFFYESINIIEGLSEKGLDKLNLKKIRKIGQLAQYNLEYLFFDINDIDEIEEMVLSSNIDFTEYSEVYNDINVIKKFFWFKGIKNIPIFLSADVNYELMDYTLDDVGLLDTVIETIEKGVQHLPNKKKDVLLRRYGINCTKMTLEEIGESYNVTRERIRQIEKRAEKDLKKFLYNSQYIDLINKITSKIFVNIGAVYKIYEIDKLKMYCSLINALDFSFYIDENFWYIVKDLNWFSIIKDYIDNYVSKNYNNLITKDSLVSLIREQLSLFNSNETDLQIKNFDDIVDDLIKEYTNHYLIKLDENNNYKLLQKSKLGKTGKVKTDERNEEIISLFSKIYPQGVHLPIDKTDKLQENLQELIDKIPYKIAIRTLSDGVIKSSNKIILWDTGFYKHVDNIKIQWSIVDETIEKILSEFDAGNSNFSIKKIFENNSEYYKQAGIPNYTALLGLIKYKENPRIGNKKLELFDIYSEGDDINKTEIIEQYLLECNNWVPTNQMYQHFCEEMGWEQYQIEQYVSNSKNAKKDTCLGFIHIKTLKKSLNKEALHELLKQLYSQIQFTHEPIKLELIRRSSFKKMWVTILNADVTGNFMSDFIDSLITQKGYPMLFYQGSAYSADYKSEELVARLNIEEIMKNYEDRNYSQLYSEFEFFDKELLDKIMASHIKIANVLFDKNLQGMCDYFYSNGINDLGTLLFFQFNCIEFKKQFTDYQIKKTIKKVYSWVESFEDNDEGENLAPDISSIFWRN